MVISDSLLPVRCTIHLSLVSARGYDMIYACHELKHNQRHSSASEFAYLSATF